MARKAGTGYEQPHRLCSEEVAPREGLKSVPDFFFEREVKIRLPHKDFFSELSTNVCGV